MLNKTVMEICSSDYPHPPGAGVEVEFETTQNFTYPAIPDWVAVPDGSLKNNSMEYIFNGPKPYEDVDGHLDDLYGVLKTAGFELHDTIRTGVHVHINVQELTVLDTLKFVLAYIMVEDLIVEW